jgi:proton-coupled amino acid transporter
MIVFEQLVLDRRDLLKLLAAMTSSTGAVSCRKQRRQDQEARILSQHLDPESTGDLEGNPTTEPGEQVNDQKSSLKTPGGDIVRDLYRIEAKPKRVRLDQRAATFSNPTREVDQDDEIASVGNPNVPGGFRRNFVQRQGGLHRRFHSMTTPVTSNFVDFLDLYGSFAGEDLHESDEEAIESGEEEEERELLGERQPLLGKRRMSFVDKGDASNAKTFFTLLKAFIGTGIMFLPKAFRNGGLLFSTITLVTVSIVTGICFRLLLQCRKKYGGGYGEIGKAISGLKLRSLILVSIAMSQIGFVCSGLIFTAENISSFVQAVSHKENHAVSTYFLIGMQLIVIIPLAFIRNVSKLGSAALLADVFILIGLTYIYYYDIATIVRGYGLNPTVTLFNPQDFTLTIGSAIFTFEGIGLILPIQASMKKPHQFGRLLAAVMIIITIIFTAVGFLSYGAFGEETRVEIITNFPQDNKLVNTVQFLYSIAVLVGEPVQLFPAVRIMEGKLFGKRSGKNHPKTKWKKNLFRATMVVISGLIAVVGAGDLDKFVSLIGSFAVRVCSSTQYMRLTARSASLSCTFIQRICIIGALRIPGCRKPVTLLCSLLDSCAWYTLR